MELISLSLLGVSSLEESRYHQRISSIYDEEAKFKVYIRDLCVCVIVVPKRNDLLNSKVVIKPSPPQPFDPLILRFS